ncbi:mechanosensitive ion channel protein 6-like [Euphorbia lathyris]|uniref:mechanosensitive ion channel protein 6-like n=1 Tax=Euphorbia lathyris TaxID=212925 RepID=UPI0033144EE2
MESLRKSLKTYRQKEESQPLLHPKEEQEQVILNIDTPNSSAKQTPNTAKPMSSSKKLKSTLEDIIIEAVRQRDEHFADNENPHLSLSDSFRRNSWKSLVNKTKSRLIDPPDEERYERSESIDSEVTLEDDDEIEEIPEEHKKMKTLSALTLLQRILLVLVSAALVSTLLIPKLKRQKIWELALWKWEIMIMTLICGHLVSGWVIKIIVIFFELNFLLKKRVLYFVYGLKKAVQNFLWLGLVVLVWHLIFTEEAQNQMLQYVTKILMCLLVGTFIWLLKTLVVKVLASSFHVNTFFERIQEALFNQYVIETFSGPPLFERRSLNDGGELGGCSRIGKRVSFGRAMSRRKEEEIAKMNEMNVSGWNVRRMVNIVRHATLSTLDEHILNCNIEDESLFHIRSEFQAKEAAKKIFLKVAKPASQYIFLDDMMRFMAKEDALRALHHFGAARENEGITKNSLNTWLVNAFRERRALALSLNDTKTAVNQLHNMLKILVVTIIIIIWLLILGLPVTNFLVFISSQLVLMAFIFGNSCKTTFEAIIFLFVMHPFDVGDRCEVDGVQMVVEEMNILTTIFLRADKQKITYPNSVLATKPIGNFYRSPDMDEVIDFCIHISTPFDKITMIKHRIKEYIESNNEHWHPNAAVIIKDVEDMNKMNMAVFATHRLNYQRMAERIIRRTSLLEEMIKVFKELNVEYRLLPVDVNVQNMPSLVSNRLPSNWTTCAN